METDRIGPSIEVDGAALRYHRIYVAHLGVADLAQKSGITRQYVHAIESGRRERVSPAVFGRLKAALQAETGDLLARAKEPVPA